VTADQSKPALRPRHSTDGSTVRRTVLAVAVAAGVVAGWTSDAAPTGFKAIDRFEVAALVTVVALASSRARRWTLIVGASVAALLTPFPLWPLAIVALVLAVGLFYRNRRDRIAGAVIGGLVGICAANFVHLGWAGPGVVALILGLILISGLRRTSRRNRRTVRRVALAAVAVTVVLIGGAGFTAVRMRGDLAIASRSTSAGASATRSGDDDEATKQFGEAARAFHSVSDSMSAPWIKAARIVPGLAQNLNAVDTAADAGAEVSASAAALMNGLDYSAVQRKEGGVDTAQLAAFAPDAARLASTMNSASRSVASAQNPLLAPPVGQRLDQMASELQTLAAQTDTAALATRLLPAILGADFARRYFVIFANPAESRDMGGLMASWAVLSADDGDLEVVESGSPIELFGPLDERPFIDDLRAVPASFLDMAPQRWPQNWTSTIDLRSATRVISDLLIDTGRQPVDGVLYLDPYALQALISLSGPVTIPGFDVELTAKNTASFFTRDQYDQLPQTPEVDRALSQLVREVLNRLTQRSLPGPQALGDLFGPLVRDGHLRFQSLREQDAPLIGTLGLGGFDPGLQRADVFGVLVRNVAPNKLDPFIRRSATYNVSWNPNTQKVRATAVLAFTNEAPPEGLSAVVSGNESGFTPGTAILRVGVLTPFKNARFSIRNGPDLAVATAEEFPAGPAGQPPIYRNTFDLHLGIGERLEVEVDLGGRLDVDAYALTVLGQPSGSGDSRIVAKLTTSRGPGGEISCRGGQICQISALRG
jgi:hypothetical protein